MSEFMESESVRFTAFAKIFNEKEFSTIFLGRLSPADLVEVRTGELSPLYRKISVFRESPQVRVELYVCQGGGI